VSAPHGLSLHEFAEHFFRVDGDEEAAAAGEDLSFLVEDFGDIGMLAAVHGFFARFDAQRLVEGDGLEIVDGHLDGDGDNVAELIDLAHGLVEDGGDDASMAVAGRSGETLPEAKAADKDVAVFVVGEAETHAVRIVLSTGEAVIFLQADECGAVTVGGFLLGRFGFGSSHDLGWDDFNLSGEPD